MVSYDKTPVARRGSETASPYRCANGENLFRKDVDAKAEQVSRLQHQQGDNASPISHSKAVDYIHPRRWPALIPRLKLAMDGSCWTDSLTLRSIQVDPQLTTYRKVSLLYARPALSVQAQLHSSC
nr:hypothetical protein L203_05367 [Cryptococcus depauperatus CBS 7841]